MTTCIKSNKLCTHVLAKIVVGASYKITFIDEFLKKIMFHSLKQKNQALNFFNARFIPKVDM